MILGKKFILSSKISRNVWLQCDSSCAFYPETLL